MKIIFSRKGFDSSYGGVPSPIMPDGSICPLTIPRLRRKTPGGGLFRVYSPDLCLTADGKSRSVWRLPEWFYPSRGKIPLSHHEDRNRWKRTNDGAILE